MMYSSLRSTAACILFFLASVLHAGIAADAVQVQEPYVRAVPPGQANSAAFMKLTNTGQEDHALVKGRSNAAKVVELHTHRMEDGMMKMRRVDKIDLPAGETVRLQPGGLHVMLIGLQEPLSPGDEVQLTLHFEDGSRSSLSVPVKSVQEMFRQQGHEKADEQPH